MDRYRPLRRTQKIRDEHSQVSLSPEDFIYPYFVVEGSQIKEEIPSLPGVFHFSIDKLLEDVIKIYALGINKILLFGVIDPQFKDETGTQAYAGDNLVARAVKAIKYRFPALIVMTDVCLCGYTTHGHCGILTEDLLDVHNDLTLPALAQMAISHARAGADYVAPSAMMDGQVDAIRKTLDNEGFHNTRIMAYSAKYASVFYGPFRGAVDCAPRQGDRSTYQMDYRNIDQAEKEVGSDIKEGADIVMVKPAAAYLDVIGRIQQQYSQVPIAAYHVSGEYMMIKTAAEAGIFDENSAMIEILSAINRAGANFIISYYAKDFCKKNCDE